MGPTRWIATALVFLVGVAGVGIWLRHVAWSRSNGYAVKLDVPLDASMAAHRQPGRCTPDPYGGCTIAYSIVIHAASGGQMYARDCYFTPFDSDGRALHGAFPFPTIAGIGIVNGVGRERGGMWVPGLLRSVIRRAVRWEIRCTAYRWEGVVPA
jgi:hypothetical protein